jgi:uridine nucleosidase
LALGESGLDGVTLLPHPVESPVEGIDYLDAMYKALIATSPQTAWLISTGTLTNSALLFQKYPDLAEHLKGFTIMGGAIGGGFTKAPMGKVQGEGERFGNWTAFAEFNVYCDPEASSFLFSHPILKSKTTLIPLDLSHKVLGTKTVQHTLLYGSDQPLDASTANMDQTPSSLRALFTQIMVFFAGTYAEVFSITEGPPLHDPLAVSAAIDPDIFDDNGGERFQIDIVTEGLHSVDQSKVGQLGRTKATKLAPGEGGCRIPRGVSLEKFWGSIEDCLKRADKISSMPKLSHAELRAHGIFGDPA